MPFLTPPTTSRKPKQRLPYYEDLYGIRNEDEELDHFADECDDETSSDEGEESVSSSPDQSERPGFFKTYSRPKTETHTSHATTVNRSPSDKGKPSSLGRDCKVHFGSDKHVRIHLSPDLPSRDQRPDP